MAQCGALMRTNTLNNLRGRRGGTRHHAYCRRPHPVLQGEPYFVQFALPNVYFHATTAYVIMRRCGVEIGKRDFLGMI